MNQKGHNLTPPTPDLDVASAHGGDDRPILARRVSRWQLLVGVLGAAVALWVGGDLVEIVSSGGSRPATGQHGGTPPPAGGHDPAGFGHGRP
ncbi:MAG: hypothetical protein ACRD2W_06590 [Acidimicrobiales bacterium]